MIFSLQRPKDAVKMLWVWKTKKLKCLSSHSHFSHILCCTAFNGLLKMMYSPLLPSSDRIFPIIQKTLEES